MINFEAVEQMVEQVTKVCERMGLRLYVGYKDDIMNVSLFKEDKLLCRAELEPGVYVLKDRHIEVFSEGFYETSIVIEELKRAYIDTVWRYD